MALPALPTATPARAHTDFLFSVEGLGLQVSSDTSGLVFHSPRPSSLAWIPTCEGLLLLVFYPSGVTQGRRYTGQGAWVCSSWQFCSHSKEHMCTGPYMCVWEPGECNSVLQRWICPPCADGSKFPSLQVLASISPW